MRHIGVDEAGKGPVLGAMVAAAVHADPATLPDTVADSKTLTADRRESIADTLHARHDIDVGIAYIPVAAIDDSATDMNTLTVDAHAAAIRALPGDLTTVHGLLDAGDVDADRFATRVTSRVDPPPTLDAEHGADTTDSVVAGASIVAKVARDAHIAAIGTGYDADIGSGYPNDPTTRTFLTDYTTDHGCLPDCARASWQTSRDAIAASTQASLEEY